MTEKGAGIQFLVHFLQRANRGVAPLSLAAFRILFGIMTFVSSARFLHEGWVQPFFGEPSAFFHYMGFSWVVIPSPQVATAIFAVMMLLSALIALGWLYRFAMPLFFVLFTYIELTDVTNYLNHYYLVSLLSFLMIWLPANRTYSVDARIHGWKQEPIPAWCIWLLRWQVGLVYFFAAMAKLQGDWLLHGQPLNIWLMAQSDFPVLGPLFVKHEIALFMSWLGFLNDLLIVPALLWSRTRIWAYAVVVSFHLLTGALFNIGMFPYIMIVSATVFFPPHWPSRFLPKAPEGNSIPASASQSRHVLGGKWLSVVVLYCIIQALIPLRSSLSTGPVIWHECGMRFSWKVKVREKNGSLSYKVTAPSIGTEVVSPEKYLTRRQAREMATQPDLILQLAHHIGEDFEGKGVNGVQVFADSFVSLNGRREKRLIDPKQDLMAVEDGFLCPDWIEQAPMEPPPRLNFEGNRRFKRRR